MSTKKCSKCDFLMDALESKCPDCGGTTFDHNIPESMKNMRVPKVTPTSKPSKASIIESMSATKANASLKSDQTIPADSELQVLIKKQDETIRAINRTTHAVRAFVLFLFYQLFALTISGILYVVAVAIGETNEACQNNPFGCNPNAFFIFLALAVWVAGVIYSSQKGWEEIEKSEIR